MKKKIISAILITAVIVSSLMLSFTALASSQQLTLDTKVTTTISGADDLEWFYYTPEKSGTYSFLTYNTPRSCAYLFVRETDEETGERTYVQLAYNSGDSDYEANGHNQYQVCLTYHLEAGTTYYYAAGWWLSTQTYSTFTVMLRCDSYDEDVIDSIEITSVPSLEAYVDGEWRTDADGYSYFWYDTSKLYSNLEIEITYLDGTVVTVTGSDEVDGSTFTYSDNQYYTHWYPTSEDDYTDNTFTIQLLDATASAEASIVVGDRYLVKGTVVNRVGYPVENAEISLGSSIVGYTDSDGSFSVYTSAGSKKLSVSTDTSIDYEEYINVSTSTNDFTDTPFVICNCDYVNDGYINAKDYSYIVNNFSGDELEKISEEFANSINFSKDKY